MEEGVPPAQAEPEPEPELEDDSALRAELEELNERQLDRRAAKAGISDDKLDQADSAEDKKAFLIELIVEAGAGKLRRTGSAPSPTKDRLMRELAVMKEKAAQAQAQAQAQQAQVGNPNIKQRLDGGQWKSQPSLQPNWWQHADLAEQVNRLRAAARIRDSLPDTTFSEIPDLYPQLIVVGDGNTGKSTVLNRFAEFAFSSVTDGVCTRRPVRLQLRPVSAKNRPRLEAEGLLAICEMEDKEDQHVEEFTLRTGHREDDENLLRLAVEVRASDAEAEPDGTQAGHDRSYIEHELVITIEADQMVYFDLLDLPGLHNTSLMPKKMIKSYINKDTLSRTFVLIFSEHKKGDTQLEQR
jgi:hypothetical protein